MSKPNLTLSTKQQHSDFVQNEKYILLAVDIGGNSLKACEWAAKHLAKPDDVIILLHVYTPVFDTYYADPEFGFITADMRKNILDKELAKAAQVVQKYIDVCKAHNVQCVSEMVEGEAKSTIVHLADHLNVKALVMGSHSSYSAARRTFLGSVSDYCAHHCQRPVVVIRS